MSVTVAESIRCRTQLSRGLVATSRKWASHIAAEESDRLTPVIEALSTRLAALPCTLFHLFCGDQIVTAVSLLLTVAKCFAHTTVSLLHVPYPIVRQQLCNEHLDNCCSFGAAVCS